MSSLLKKILIAAAGVIASYYTTKTVKAALERKPLKTRVREGKEKVAQMRDTAATKASDMKSAAKDKADQAKAKVSSLIEERPADEYKSDLRDDDLGSK